MGELNPDVFGCSISSILQLDYESKCLDRLGVAFYAASCGLHCRKTASNGDNSRVSKTLARPGSGFILEHMGQSVAIDEVNRYRLLPGPIVEPADVPYRRPSGNA
jgi:hypothetical protein